MKYNFKIKNIDCPVCAGKIETRIQKIKGINEASLNFISESLFVEADDELTLEELTKSILKAARKVEREAELIAL